MKTLAWIVGIFGALVLYVFLFGNGDGSSSSRHARQSESALRTAVQVQAENVVREVLKAPSTADFQSWPEVRQDGSSRLFSVIGHVDAQNAFGAQIRNEYVVILRRTCDNVYSGGCWDLLKLGVGDQMFVDRPLPGDS